MTQVSALSSLFVKFLKVLSCCENSSIENTNSSIFATIADESAIFANLTKAAEQHGHFKVYNRTNIPARWHANNPTRMGPIFVVADVGYGFQDLMEAAKYYERAYNVPSEWNFE